MRVERDCGVLGAVALATAYVDAAVFDAEQEADAESERCEGEHEAADRALVAVDAGGEVGVVACGEGVDGVGEEGDERGGAVADDGALQGSDTVTVGCAQAARGSRARERRDRCGG